MSAVEAMGISRTVSDGLGRLAALAESPAVIEFRTARTLGRLILSFLKK
jgi:hypothetical protein